MTESDLIRLVATARAEGRKVAIFPCGKIGAFIGNLLSGHGMTADFYVDNFKKGDGIYTPVLLPGTAENALYLSASRGGGHIFNAEIPPAHRCV